MTTSATADILWTPSAARIEAARITAYRRWLQRERGLYFDRYDDLWQWSVDRQEDFWQSVWQYFEVRAAKPCVRLLADARMPGATWGDGAEVNFVDQIFRHRDLASPALVFESEALGSGTISRAELERQVANLAATLRGQGVGRGDRVIAYLPNVPQAVVAFLAVASLGAIWSICSPDMGATLIVDRFRQIEPKALITCDGYRYAGKPFDRREVVTTLLEALPTVEAIVWVPVLDAAGVPPGGSRATTWSDATAGDAQLRSEALPFSHPLWILYSSGTTGLPKAIVHGHGGALLNGLVSLGLHTDAGPGDRLFWVSSTGWMVWNVQVMALLTGATVYLYDGAVTGPGPQPDWNFLWRFVARHRIKTFGCGAAFHASCLKADVRPGESCDLSALEAVGSTGSPLSPDCYRWIYAHVKRDLWLCCVSGGTDIVGAFLTGLPTLPVYQGEMQCRSLGAAVYAFDDAGQPVVDAVGELVCTRPLPSMPLYFWNDEDDVRYRESYFDTFVGADGAPVWRHGDWLRLTPRPDALGGIIYGRSDATINRQGIRMGTAELYRAVEQLPEVLDSMVVDLEYLGRESYMALFVVLRPGLVLGDELIGRLRLGIRSALSPRHVPDDIIQVAEVPRTLTGKKLELPIKKLLLGHAVDKVINRDALANPGCIDWYVAFARRRQTASGAAMN